MSFYSVVDFIRVNYPKYFGIQSYPVSDCIRVHKISEEWGVFHNFYATPIKVDGVTFKNAEQLFQLMKFKDPVVIRRIWNGITSHDKQCHDIKRTVKSYEKRYRRSDWGVMILDALKFTLMKKYEQCEFFRKELERSNGRYIVEDQTNFPKKQPDAWGVKLQPDGETFAGPNLLGRLLMELRNSGGELSYTHGMPDDAFAFLDVLR